MQRPPHAGAAFAWWAIRGRGRELLLLPLRGRLRGVAGGLRRPGQFVEPRLQGRDACILRGNVGVRQRQPGGQRADQRVLLGVGQLHRGREQGHPMCRIRSPVTASRNFWVWLPYQREDRLIPRRKDAVTPGEQLRFSSCSLVSSLRSFLSCIPITKSV